MRSNFPMLQEGMLRNTPGDKIKLGRASPVPTVVEVVKLGRASPGAVCTAALSTTSVGASAQSSGGRGERRAPLAVGKAASLVLSLTCKNDYKCAQAPTKQKLD